MSYYITVNSGLPFQEAIDKVTEELKNEGFGVITTIDVKNTLKEKIDVDFRRYTILGACNPGFAHQALSMDDKIGTLLPCNVIVQEKASGTEISAINPTESMKGILSEELTRFAAQITGKLDSVIKAFE
jgi:uncharacterized protein (DUF302 family)